MGDYSEGEWCRIWDGLYWRFVDKHRDFFERNPRMKVMVHQIDRMGRARMKEHLAIANRFLERG
jgi:deoxyribodipyrimidine photolyase-related protein